MHTTAPAHPFVHALLAGAVLIMPVSGTAQQAGEQEDVFELSPFEVQSTAEQGYLATETISATRFAVDRRDLPFSITTITSDALEDAHVVNAIEALDLSSSATPAENVWSGNDNRPTIRGTSSPRFFVEGIFYNSTQAPGSIAVDSIEILKGTSAMLYGQGEPGGTINYQLKKPQKKPEGRLQGMLGSYHEREAKLDYTGPLNGNKTLTFRVGYGYFYGENQHDRYANETHDGFARLRYEYGGYNRYVDVYHAYSWARTDGVIEHVLDGYHGITNLQMKTDIFTQFTSAGFPNPLELGMINPDSHNNSAEGSFAKVESKGTTVTWNHSLSRQFTFRASYNRTDMPRHLWRNLADPMSYVEKRPSRNYLFTDPETGLPQLITVYSGDLVKNTGGRLRDDQLTSDSFVLNLLGEFIWRGVIWKSVVGVDAISEAFSSESWYSNYHYDLTAGGTARLKAFGDRIPIVLGNVFRPEEGLTAASEPLSSYTIHDGYSVGMNDGEGYYWTNFLQFFEGRLSAVGSLRYDRSRLKTDALRPERTDGLEPFIPGRLDKFDDTTYSIGGNWLVLRNWGLFANYATTFRPETSARTGLDRQLITDNRKPFEGDGWDAGVKFSTADGRLFVMATAFETRKRNLWGRMQGQEIDSFGNPVWLDEDKTVPSIINYDAQTGEQLVEGVEVEFTGEPVKDLQLRLGWTWLYSAEISRDVDPFLVGQRLNNSPEHKISAGLSYTIREGWLSQSSIGFNVTSLIDDRIYWVGPNNRRLSVSSLGDGSPFIGEADRFWGKGYTKVDFFFRKRFKITRTSELWARLNFYNILDTDHQRYRSIGTPRSARFSFEYRW